MNPPEETVWGPVPGIGGSLLRHFPYNKSEMQDQQQRLGREYLRFICSK